MNNYKSKNEEEGKNNKKWRPITNSIGESNSNYLNTGSILIGHAAIKDEETDASSSSYGAKIGLMNCSRNEWIERANKFTKTANEVSRKYPSSLRANIATDHFQRAAVAFMCAQKWHDAADAYYKASTIQFDFLSCTEEAGILATMAAEAKLKVDPLGAVRFYHKAVSHYCKGSQFARAGRIQRKTAEILEQHSKNFKQISEEYRRAANLYHAGKVSTQSYLCLLNSAHFLGLNDCYEDSYKLYMEIAKVIVQQDLLKYNCNNCFLRAGLIIIRTHSFEELRKKLLEFHAIDATFSMTREYLFIKSLGRAVNERDIHAFADNVYLYDSVKPLDTWCLRLLNAIKKTLISFD